MSDVSAVLHARANCDQGDTCRWYFEYWPANGTREFSTKTSDYGPVNGPTGDQDLSVTIEVQPNTTYRWVFCGSPNNGRSYACAGPNGKFGSSSADPPPDYDTFTSGSPGTLAELWNGSSWSIQSTPTPAGANSVTLRGVSCTSPSACSAAGEYGTASSDPLPLAERWNGTSWQIQTVPQPPGATNSDLAGISCPSLTACTAVGDTFNPSEVSLAERWNGSSWQVQSTPNPSNAQDSQLSGVSCKSSTACVAVGWAFIGDQPDGPENATFGDVWNGTSWALQSVPSPSDVNASLNAVSCTSPSACTAVGGAGPTSNHLVDAVRYNGTSWSSQSISTPVAGGSGFRDGELNAVSCTSATSCTAVGSANGNTLAEHWDGTAWSIQATPNPSGTASFLNGVSCTSATACIAVGFTDHPVGTGIEPTSLAEQWDGTKWTIVPTPAVPGMSSLWGDWCSTATSCVAVGGR